MPSLPANKRLQPKTHHQPQPAGQGYATAEILSSPSGFSSLHYDNATGGDGTASLTDGRGRASFSGLFLKESGEGFVCRFVAFNAAGVGVAWADSDPFDVEVGEPYAIALTTPVGRMEGGSRFDVSPVVTVQVSGLILAILRVS